jgi:hypothetical protein
MRTELLSAITTAISTLTQFAVSSELPWEQNGMPLYRKNMKKIYVGPDTLTQSALIPTLDHVNVLENNTVNQVFLSVDAKNNPTQLPQAIAAILSARDRTGIVNFVTEADYTQETSEDVLTYTFEFRLNSITT